MIAFVCGHVSEVGPTEAVVEVGGVGLAVQCTPGTLAGLRHGERATLATTLVVREESLTLYGFACADERTVFELLQTASGVGPRLAQAMLAVHDPDALRRAVAEEDLTALTQVPGIGRKGAQRIVLELKDRLGPPSGPQAATIPAGSADADGLPGAWQEQVRGALVNLGWSAREAEAAVATVAGPGSIGGRPGSGGPADPDRPTDSDGPDVAALLRSALKVLNRT